MRSMVFVGLCAALLMAACDDGGKTTSGDTTASSSGGGGTGGAMTGGGGTSSSGGGEACGPTQLCERTIQECGENLTQATCEGFYANEANCADMAGYVACNCECVKEATCDDYFACGNLCFNDSCK